MQCRSCPLTSGLFPRFLDLLSNVTNASYVPTLDIDIVWHTHQLKGGEYLNECKELVGWYVDQ